MLGSSMVRLESTISAQAFELTSAMSDSAATTPKNTNEGRPGGVDAGSVCGLDSTGEGAGAASEAVESGGGGALLVVAGSSVLGSLIGGSALLRHVARSGHRRSFDHGTFV
jgi:hypothetical protein